MAKDKRTKRGAAPSDHQAEIDAFPNTRAQLEQQLGAMTAYLQRLSAENPEELQRLLANPFGFNDLDPAAVGHHEPATPLERAQEKIYSAFEATSSRERIRLARETLKMSADCADAYVLLGNELATTPKEALSYYEQGIAAGKRALGEEPFEEFVGDFWHILDTRPYMRAMEGKSQALQALGRAKDAIDVLKEMLRLNPGDNQGMRYVLIALLLDVDDLDRAGALLKAYPDEASATWLYSRTLLKFRRAGDSPFPMRALAFAMVVNPHVPAYLTGEKPTPRSSAPYYSPGQDSEAVWYAQEQKRFWTRTPGAIEWLRTASDRIVSLPSDGEDAVLRYRVPGGSGPNFFLNTSTYARYTRCPACDELTKQRIRRLTVFLEPNAILVSRQQCRYCPHDDLLIAHADQIEASLERVLQESHADLIGNDYVVVGDVAAHIVKRRGDGPIQPDWVQTHTVLFREQRQYPEPWGTWLYDSDLFDPVEVELDDPVAGVHGFDFSELDAGIRVMPELPHGEEKKPAS